jgi:hypothetical protein
MFNILGTRGDLSRFQTSSSDPLATIFLKGND